MPCLCKALRHAGCCTEFVQYFDLSVLVYETSEKFRTTRSIWIPLVLPILAVGYTGCLDGFFLFLSESSSLRCHSSQQIL